MSGEGEGRGRSGEGGRRGLWQGERETVHRGGLFTAWVVAGRLAGRASGWATWSTALGVPYWTVAVENRLRGRRGRGDDVL